MLRRNEVEEIVTAVLHEQLDENGFSGSEIRIEDDSFGEETIYVTAQVKDKADVQKILNSMFAIRKQLLDAEDDRFISVTQSYPGINDGMSNEDEDED